MAEVTLIAQTNGAADAIERERLKLRDGDIVVRVARIRKVRGRPMSYELIVLPLARFPGLLPDSEIEVDVVALARAHGVGVGRATETLDDVFPPPK